MKTLASLGLALAIVLGLVSVAVAADETTVTGTVMCAKCTAKKADAKQCQNLLVVKDGDKTTEYYVEDNDVAKKFGHVCTGQKEAVVTGTVTEKDGKKWIAPSRIEEKKS